MNTASARSTDRLSVLWLDDDCTMPSLKFPQADVRTVTTCKRAAAALEEGGRNPDWIVVDLIVPQEGWGKGILRHPGVQFLEHVKTEYPDVRLCAYAGFIDSHKDNAAREAGALVVHDKTEVSFADLLKILYNQSANPATAKEGE